jgi:two-component sensor histidine kinase/CheY-like chemotaxis protein
MMNPAINSPPSRILVVDDDPAIVEAMQDFLEEMGYEVFSAVNGTEGRQRAIELNPDLIIMDVDMPGMSGIELCRQLRLEPQTQFIPIVIQTGFGDNSTLMECLEAGCDEFMNKPPNVPILRARVVSLLRISHQRNEIIQANAALDAKIHLLEQNEGELKQLVNEKEALLKELYHRTKNNMQSITALLNLQMYQTNDPKLEQAFRVTQDRIRSMALVHKKLYQSNSLDHVDLGEYLSEKIETDPIMIKLEKAIPVGLIVNELMTNALKYAFPNAAKGSILLQTRDLGGQEVQIMVTDNGQGLPEETKPYNGETLGFRLVRSIAEDQLLGKLDIPPRRTGLSVAVRFSLDA